MRRWQSVIDDTGSEEAIYAFIYCTKWRSGRVSRIPDRLTDNFERQDQVNNADSAIIYLINH